MTEKISKENFFNWKSHPVTKEIFMSLQVLRNNINESLIDASIIMEDKNGKAIARLVGQREGLDVILQINADQLVNAEESADEDTSSGT